MRDYEADSKLGEDYQGPKTPHQHRRDEKIQENERLYLVGERKLEDVRKFLEAARCFMEPDVSKITKLKAVYVENKIINFTFSLLFHSYFHHYFGER